MKMKSIAALAIISLFTTKNVIAADLISSDYGKEKIGVISVSGMSTPSEVSGKLRERAVEAGATAYKIIATGGNNRQFGVAVIYR